MSIKYTQWRSLDQRDAVNSAPSQMVDGTLLVATEPALTYVDNQSSYGEDYVSLFAAFHNGTRCWVRREEWSAASGYSAEGTQETIVPFEDGVKTFLDREIFVFPLNASVA